MRPCPGEQFAFFQAGDDCASAPIAQLLGSWITYRIAVGLRQGRKVQLTSPPRRFWRGAALLKKGGSGICLANPVTWIGVMP